MPDWKLTTAQMQALSDAMYTAGVPVYSGYQFSDHDVEQINDRLQAEGIQVPLVAVRLDFPTKYGTNPIEDIGNTLDRLDNGLKDLTTRLEAGLKDLAVRADCNATRLEHQVEEEVTVLQGIATSLNMMAAQALDPLGLPPVAAVKPSNAREAAQRVLGALLQRPEVAAELQLLMNALQQSQTPTNGTDQVPPGPKQGNKKKAALNPTHPATITPAGPEPADGSSPTWGDEDKPWKNEDL